MSEFTTQLAAYGVVPVVAINSVEHALPLAEALIAGGLPVVEITFRTPAAAESISAIAKAFPEMLVGAGTVLSPETLRIARDNGAVFAVAPGLNPCVLDTAKSLRMPFIPGVATPSEVECALGYGCKLLKFFPAEAIGGTKLLKAISAPYKHTNVKFMPTGGISPDNLPSWMELDTVVAVGGTWLAKGDDMDANRWPAITQRCVAARTLVDASKKAVKQA